MKIKLGVFLCLQMIVSVFASAASLEGDLYLDLMKKVLVNTIYEDSSCTSVYNFKDRSQGSDYPIVAHTMVGLERLNNIQKCVENVLQENVPGDLIETGVWRGGSSIFMRAILKVHADSIRKVWVADSFEGLPPPNLDKYPEDRGLDLYKIQYLAVPLEVVQDNFKKYNLLDDQVVFLKGFFKDTLPTVPVEQFAILRLDGDLYESTMDALMCLYPKLSIGGYIIIDDFGAISACAKAVHDYRNAFGITDRIEQVDWTGVYWKKTK